jgi:hypothetical protein
MEIFLDKTQKKEKLVKVIFYGLWFVVTTLFFICNLTFISKLSTIR